MTTYNVTSGQSISGITLSSGDFANVSSGGAAIDIVASSQAGLTVFSGGVASFTVLSGGFDYVSSGGTAIGTVIGAGTEAVYRGGSASFAVVSANGGEVIYSGGHALSATLSGGLQAVYAGGTVSDATVSSGGGEYLYSGGDASGTVVREGGGTFVYSGGVASYVVVSGGGTIAISTGGNAEFLTVSSGASIDLPDLTFSSGGSAIVNGAGLLTVVEGVSSTTLQLSGQYLGDSFLPATEPNGGTGTLLTLFQPPRTLVWTGALDTVFGDAADWNDVTNGANPAQSPPNASDTTLFLTGGGSITGSGTVAALALGGTAPWQATSAASLSAVTGVTMGQGGSGTLLIDGGASIDGLGSLDEISGDATVTVAGSGAAWNSEGELIVGAATNGELDIDSLGSVQAGYDPAGSGGIDLGLDTGGSGRIQVAGTGSLLRTTGTFIVGDSGLGTLSITAAGIVSSTQGAGSGDVVIANAGSASGSSVGVTGAGSRFQVLGSLIVGNAGFGQLSISQSAAVSAWSLDTGASAGGDGAITVTGTGSAVNIAGLLTVGDQAVGSLNISNGASVSVAGLSIGAGAPGSGDVLIGPGSFLTLTGTGINVGLAGSAVLDIQGGTLNLASGTTLSPGIFGRIVQVGGLIDPATVFDASGGSFGGGGTAEASGTIVNSSLASITGGAETLLAPLISSSDPVNIAGVWSIESGGTLVLDVNTFDNSQTILFGDLTGVLTIGQQVTLDATQTPQPVGASALSGFAAPIVGFKTGDQITIPGLNVASDSVSGNVLTLWSGPDATGTDLGSLAFQTAKGGPDSVGAQTAAALFVGSPNCFAAGTRIATVAGSCAVEALEPGDRIALAYAGSEPVVWIGQWAVDCAQYPDARPVRVRAGAFGRALPFRDLYLSPDHAVLVNNTLVPVKLLINGSSILWEDRPFVTYYHVELREHSVILAEGLPVESYLRDEDRIDLPIGTISYRSDFASRRTPLLWETRGAAKLVTTGSELEAARRVMQPGRHPL